MHTRAQINQKIIWILLTVLLICFLPMHAYATESEFQEKDEKHVLYISSYSFSWATVPRQIEGLEDALGQDYILNYEFMDTKNTTYSDGYKEFYDLLSYKLTTRDPYDALVVADDAALNFAVLYQDELFPDIPIIFLGIDHVENAIKARENPYMTGIVEEVDYEKNLELAKKLFPDATRLVFILDDAENGKGIQKQLEKNQAVFSNYEVEYINSSLYSQEEFCNILEHLDHTSIVFCVSMSQRADGIIYTEDERYQMLERHTHVPLLRVSNSGVGDCGALLGGYIVSHKESGRLAGEMLKEALSQGDIASISVNLDTPHEYFFNWQVMKRYHLKKQLFPKESTFLNEEPTFMETHYQSFLIASAMMIVLLLLVWFANSYKTRKKLEDLNQRLDAGNHQLNLRNRELIAKNMELEKISTYKSDFLSRVSHDIRTPMNTILNLTNMVEAEIDDKETAIEDLHKIETSNRFLLSLVNDILDMSRIEQKNIELHPERYSYHEFLNYIASTFEPLGKSKNIELSIEKGEIDADIMIDKVRFNQLCFNLLSNAIKYTSDGGHVIFRMVHGEMKDGILPCDIYIIDDGIGMSEEFQRKMFEPFSQEGRAFASVEGTGLGLSIVKEIVDLLGAKIEVHSELNKGTTFHVQLDMVLAGVNDVKQQMRKVEPGQLAGKHILIAEDHHLNQEIVKRLLQKVGVEVTITNNGQEVVEEFKKHADQYDAILMDMRMPVMDGIQATMEIRKLDIQKAKQIPIIAMTANAFAEDREKTVLAGMNAHLSKPVDPQMMYETIADCLQDVARL